MEPPCPLDARRLYALIGDAELKRHGKVALPIRILQSLDAILEILHAAHVARVEGDPGSVIGEHLVEGLIVAAQSLVKDSTDATWGDA